MVSVRGQNRERERSWSFLIGRKVGRGALLGLLFLLVSGSQSAAAWSLANAPRAEGQRAELRLGWRGGAADDAPGLEGESLIFARSLFSGTRTRPGATWMEAFTSFGAELSVLIRETATEVRVLFPEENLSAVLQLLGDALTQPAFQSRDLLDLQDRMIREGALEAQTPAWRLERGARRFLYPPGSLSVPRGGTKESLLRISPHNLFARHSQWIHRGNLKLSFRTQLDRDRLMDVLDREWGALPEGALIEKSPSTRIEKAKPWAVILEDASAESVELFFYLPSLPLFAERRLALELLVNTLLHDEEARFQLVLKEAYRGRFPPRIWLNMGGPGRLEDRDSQVTEIQLSLDARVTPGLVARLWEVFSAWAGEEIKPEQLLRAKVRVRDRFESLLGEAVELNLGLLFAEPPVQKDFSFLDRLESVTMGELDSLRSHFGADAFKGLSFWGPSDEVRPLFESIFGVERVRMEGTLK